MTTTDTGNTAKEEEVQTDCATCRERQEQDPDKAQDVRSEMADCMGRSMETLSSAFQASAKRWEAIVYPSLFAFIILAGYGFYLIYSLTQDAHRISENMELISNNMLVVAQRMETVSNNTDQQSAAMRDMVVNMHNMNVSMSQMRHDMSVMNYSVSRPMNKLNSFMPW